MQIVEIFSFCRGCAGRRSSGIALLAVVIMSWFAQTFFFFVNLFLLIIGTRLCNYRSCPVSGIVTTTNFVFDNIALELVLSVIVIILSYIGIRSFLVNMLLKFPSNFDTWNALSSVIDI